MIQRYSDTTVPSALSPAPTAPLSDEGRRCLSVHHALRAAGLFESSPAWRVSPVPFQLTADEVSFFEDLGPRLWSFSKALSRLYLDSVKGRQPFWVHQYLDQGKPQALLEYARMKRFREALPRVIRPDVIPTEAGMTITELDSVPGGIGITGSLSSAYAALGDTLVGGASGMIEGFAMLFRSGNPSASLRAGTQAGPYKGRADSASETAGCVAIVVSDEAEDYRTEMDWVACRLRAAGMDAHCVHPRDLRFSEDKGSFSPALFARTPSGERPVSHVYRFFELFDLENIPKSELLMYCAKKGRVSVTPPYKPWMEEKLAFALLHHPMLEGFWSDALGPDVFAHLRQVMPRTWVVDPRPLPPSAIIPDLTLDGKAVSDWRQLARATQKQRQCVLKPSGFSELAWGSRGVVVGHDIPQSAWAAKLDHALDAFTSTPYVLQAFHKGRQYEMTYWDERTGQLESMEGRARLSPYYFVSGDEVTLGGILATVCPKDKKVLHGMRDAILAPCALRLRSGQALPAE
ncbi:MAG: hypothetical protein OXF97_03620 [Nitrospira sp.]|nr:hypothetical protein [Nitrospira sp.]